MVAAEASGSVGTPMFSIVIPVLNRADVINRCLASLLAQRGPSFELIVMDGASTDGTLDAIQTHAHSLAYWESQRDEGIYDAWNKGLTHARGAWIGFLGADDTFATTGVLARMADAIAAAPPEVSIVYPRAVYADDKGVIHGESGSAWTSAKKRLFRGMMTVPPAVFYRRDVFERNGRFDTAFKICGDFDMVLREARTHEAEYVESATIVVGVGGVSWKPENKMTIMAETRASLKKNAIGSIPWEWYRAYLQVTPVYRDTRKWVARVLRRVGLLATKNSWR